MDSRLAGLGIQKMDSPPFKRDFQLDEEQLKSLLVQEGFEEFRASTDRDVGCVSSINRFRKGKEVYTSSKEIHIFLTKNPTLNRVANNFFLNEKLSSQNSVPPLMSESIIASLLFANNSVDFESLGPKLVLSHAYSVIFTDDKFMEKYSERLDSLLKREIITEDQYILYRYDHELRSFINNYRVTNDLEELDEDGFAEMFRKIKEREKRIIEEKSEAYENQIREIKKDTTREKDRNRQLSQNNTEMKKENKKLKEEQSMLVDKTARQEKFINFILASFVFVALIGLNITIESLSEAYKKSGYSNFVIPVYAVGSIIIYIKGVPFFKIVTFIKKKLKID